MITGPMAAPLVSIMVPTYNHVGFIGAALDSALAQTYPNIEVVIADDGSTDGTMEIVQSYAAKYADRIVALPSAVNSGLSGVIPNCNRAFRACRGKYLCVLEGDDLYLPEKIARQVAWMEEDDRRVVCLHDFEIFDSVTGAHVANFTDKNRLSTGVGAEDFVSRRVDYGTVSRMVRASVVPAHGSDLRLRVVADWLFICECLAAGGVYGHVDGVLARYRLHPYNITRMAQLDQVRFEDQLTTLALLQARYPHLTPACREGRAETLFWHAWSHLKQGEQTPARRLAMAAVREKLSIRRLGLAAVVLLPKRPAQRLVKWYRHATAD